MQRILKSGEWSKNKKNLYSGLIVFLGILVIILISIARNTGPNGPAYNPFINQILKQNQIKSTGIYKSDRGFSVSIPKRLYSVPVVKEGTDELYVFVNQSFIFGEIPNTHSNFELFKKEFDKNDDAVIKFENKNGVTMYKKLPGDQKPLSYTLYYIPVKNSKFKTKGILFAFQAQYVPEMQSIIDSFKKDDQ